jgi:glycosyltransferase involved in cell wall biosynthesis
LTSDEGYLVVAMVPTCDGERFLEATLASLVAQDHRELRILISDDASTDGTWPICEAAAAADSRITAVRQPVRLGWIGNSNSLLAMLERIPGARAAFFAPHDDTFAPSYVRELLTALLAAPDAVLAYADTIKFGGSWEQLATAQWTVRPGSALRRGLRYVLHVDSDRWTPFRGLVRVETLRRAGGLRPSWAGEFEADGRWLFRLHLLGPFVRVPYPLCRKYIHAESLANVNRATPRRWAVHTLSYCEEILRAPGLGPGARIVLLLAAAAQALIHLVPGVRTAARSVFRRLAP